MDTDQVSEVPATQKRSNEELEDLELPSAENATNGLDNAPKKARIDHEDEGDTNGDEDSNSKNMEIDSENADLPSTKQAGDLEAALERAKQYAMQVQEELVKAGALSSATEAEPSLVVSNTVEQRKSLCRVYVGSISFEATEEDVRQKLGRFGAIRELVLKVDPLSGKHRGFCFVEYELPEASILAVQASESVEVVGRHLKIGRPKNYDAKAIHELPPPPEDRIYVANIGSLVTESDLSTIFQAFGPVEECSLTPDPVTRKHKGYGYVQFKQGTNIDALVESMKGFMLLDLPMGVCKAIIGGPIPEGMKALEHMPLVPETPASSRPATASGAANPVNPAMIARANATAASTAQRLVAMGQAGGAGGPIGDRESVASEENMSISGKQRYLVMQSLARSGGGAAAMFPGSVAATSAQQEAQQSNVVRLQYTASPEDIDDQLEDEFREECSKYGPVARVQLLPLADGLLRIFIQFASFVDARSAAAQLNGRQFDGKTIQATLFDQQEFTAGRLA